MPVLYDYLEEHHQSSFQNVTYRALRAHTDIPGKSQFLSVLKNAYCGLFFDRLEMYQNAHNLYTNSVDEKKREARVMATFFAPIVFVFGPLYIITRILGILYPIIMVIDEVLVHSDESFQWDFQWVMLGIYVLVEIVIVMLFLVKVGPMQHAMWHILPSRSNVILFGNDRREAMRRVDELKFGYEVIAVIPMIKDLIIGLFGEDVCEIVMGYYIDPMLGDFPRIGQMSTTLGYMSNSMINSL